MAAAVERIDNNEPIVFRHDDQSYKRWLIDNPKGFLISTRASKSAKPQVHFHTVSCGVHARNAGSVSQNTFTGLYVKACSNSIAALYRYTNKYYPNRPRHVCGCCRVALTDALDALPDPQGVLRSFDGEYRAHDFYEGRDIAGDSRKTLHHFMEGLIKTLPDPNTGEQWPLERRIKWLQTAASIFDLIYKSDGGITIEPST